MKVFVNELSFDGEAKNGEQAFFVLAEMVKIAGEVMKQANGAQVHRHRELKNKALFGDVTIIEFLHSLHRETDPIKKNMLATFLNVFAKAPFAEKRHTDNDTVTDSNNSCLKDTCFDDASGSCCGAVILSSSLSQKYKSPLIHVISSIDGKCAVLNLFDLSAAKNETREYQSNRKHEREHDGFVDGEIHSAMDLAENVAQKVLTNGILIGKSVYNVFGGRWYKFHPHRNGNYHGFPIKDNSNLWELALARKFLQAHGENEHGQVDARLLSTRLVK